MSQIEENIKESEGQVAGQRRELLSYVELIHESSTQIVLGH